MSPRESRVSLESRCQVLLGVSWGNILTLVQATISFEISRSSWKIACRITLSGTSMRREISNMVKKGLTRIFVQISSAISIKDRYKPIGRLGQFWNFWRAQRWAVEREQEKESWNGRGETTRKGKTCFLIKEGGEKEKTQEEKPKGRKQVCGEKTQKW